MVWSPSNIKRHQYTIECVKLSPFPPPGKLTAANKVRGNNLSGKNYSMMERKIGRDQGESKLSEGRIREYTGGWQLLGGKHKCRYDIVKYSTWDWEKCMHILV